MNELFGISTTSILGVLLALLGVAIATVVYIALTNRVMFMMGLRNLPRRGTQTVLVVFGLMLSTLIITAAFVTGDTIDHSLTKGSYDLLQRSDLDVTWNGERDFSADSGAANAGEQAYVDQSVVADLETAFASDAAIEGFLPFLYVQAPVNAPRTGQAMPSAQLVGFDPERLARLGGLTFLDGSPAPISNVPSNQVWLSERAARELDARLGDVITVHVNHRHTDVRVAGIVRDELASGVLGLSYSRVPGGIAMPLPGLRAVLGVEGRPISSITVALKGDVYSTAKIAEAPRDRIEAFLAGSGAGLFAGQGLPEGREVEVKAIKQDLVEQGEFTGNLFTTFFLVLGLFSMAAGVMLIFMIFVMLAAERRSEMGMARAVGAKRRHLVQSFIAEGMAYSLLAGLVGAAAGVAASIGMTDGLLKGVGGEYFSIVETRLTWKSVLIGYSLGVVITFLTVVFASMKVTHVNIVAAIRQLPDDKVPEPRRKTRWTWVILGVPAMVIPPVGLWFMLRKGFGLPKVWIFAPLGIVAGALLMALGKSSEVLFPFALGISLLPLSVAGIARRLGAPNRATWTTVGILLIAYWLMPPAQHDALFGEFSSDIEMFVLSGIMICVAATLVVVFNARLLTALFGGDTGSARAYVVPALVSLAAAAAVVAGLAVGSRGEGLGQLTYLVAGLLAPTAGLSFAAIRFPSLAPALKMAVAYPLSNRFRTGMTIAMFSLIVFSLTVFSVLLANFGAVEGGDAARGNLDIVGTVSATSGVADVPAALAESGNPAFDEIQAAGQTTLFTGSQEVRQLGLEDGATGCGSSANSDGYCRFPVLAANDAFLSELAPGLDARASGYGSAADILEAVRTNSSLALVDYHTVISRFGLYDFFVEGVEVVDHEFAPFEVQYRDPATGKTATVTVIGVLRTGIDQSFVGGLYVNESAYRATFGEPRYQRLYLRLNEDADARSVARAIEAELGVQGVEADSIKKLLDDSLAQNIAFNRMFQAFMALGLLVGIAGLGVIASRSVVERRQQIGMLRAIGFQRGTVSLTFLLESSFVAVMGILSGVVGGAILGRNLLTSESFTDGASIQFAIPWVEVVSIVAISFAFSLVMTWLPSRGASRVPVADALRYE